jgi:hypothetical protein
LAAGFFVVDFFSVDAFGVDALVVDDLGVDALGAVLADLEDDVVGFVERGRDAMDSSLG